MGDDTGKGEFDFEVQMDAADELQLRTSCCCCICGFDDCSDWMGCKGVNECLCCKNQAEFMLFQCTDQSARACCKSTCKYNECDLTDEEGNFVLLSSGCRGVNFCCMIGKAYYGMCDPCEMPTKLCLGMSQCLCIHHRVSLPCDPEYVPFEIACCGFVLAGGPEEASSNP